MSPLFLVCPRRQGQVDKNAGAKLTQDLVGFVTRQRQVYNRGVPGDTCDLGYLINRKKGRIKERPNDQTMAVRGACMVYRDGL